MQGSVQDQLVNHVMQVQPPTGQDHGQQHNGQHDRVGATAVRRGWIACGCLLALTVAWISNGRAAEPRQPAPVVRIVPVVPVRIQPNISVESAAIPMANPSVTVPAAPTGPHVNWAAPILVQATPVADITIDIFLDRLMRAESGGRLTARSSTSTALGPFQFIDATFLRVVRRHFATETAALNPAQVLALRTDMAFSRRAAEAFTNENAALLVGAGFPATFQNLRLAYLMGAGGAIKVLQTDPAMPLIKLLPANVIRANSFMRPLTVSGLVARATREVAVPPTSVAGLVAKPAAPAEVAAAVAHDGAPAAVDAKAAKSAKVAAVPPRAAPPTIIVSCDLGLASCRRWLALEQRRQGTRAVGVREARAR
jgi:hypothetical protein